MNIFYTKFKYEILFKKFKLNFTQINYIYIINKFCKCEAFGYWNARDIYLFFNVINTKEFINFIEYNGVGHPLIFFFL